MMLFSAMLLHSTFFLAHSQESSQIAFRDALIKAFIAPHEGTNLDFFTSYEYPLVDVCRWKGVLCSNDEVKAIFISPEMRAEKGEFVPLVDIRWLPPTLEYIHFVHVILYREFHAAIVPRKLKYLYLKNVQGFLGVDNRQSIDLQNLPLELEEFIVLESLHYCGTLKIMSIPPRMRMLWIESTGSFHAMVNKAAFPESFKHFYLCDPFGQVSLITFRGKKVKCALYDTPMGMREALRVSASLQLMERCIRNGKDESRELMKDAREGCIAGL